MKFVPNWVSVILTDLDYPLNPDYSAFGYKTKNASDLLQLDTFK